jgi:hypothetical protein
MRFMLKAYHGDLDDGMPRGLIFAIVVTGIP